MSGDSTGQLDQLEIFKALSDSKKWFINSILLKLIATISTP